jgi:hypothetical protein
MCVLDLWLGLFPNEAKMVLTACSVFYVTDTESLTEEWHGLTLVWTWEELEQLIFEKTSRLKSHGTKKKEHQRCHN